MELGIDAAAGVLAEEGDDQALGVDLVDSVGPPASDPAVVLQPADGGVDGGVVGTEDLGLDPGVGRQRLQTETDLAAEKVASKARAALGPKP